jgi:deoxyribodipyrimidine photo-lyase
MNLHCWALTNDSRLQIKCLRKIMTTPQKLNIPADRVERLHYIKRMFTQAAGPDLDKSLAGGRSHALARLHSVDAQSYARNRNFINGAVTQLSPYLRYGCLTLNETFAAIKTKFGVVGENLLMQLAWRDFWRQVWYANGDAIFSEIEAPKVGIAYAPLSDFVKQGNTGLPCMDAFVDELLSTGYMHNHARMWFSSYVVHHLKVDWREAADWFEAKLLDGDFASNHLSWQWIASTFSSKPYYFNKENLGRYTGEKYCSTCTAKCPFDDDYEVLKQRLFTEAPASDAKQYSNTPPLMHPPSGHTAVAVYVHDEMLSATNPLLNQPFPKIFIFDPQIYQDWPLARLQFIADSLSEMMHVEVWVGDTYEVLMQRAVGKVISQDTPNLKVKQLLSAFTTKWQPVPKLANVELSAKRLLRYSRYWEKVGPVLLDSKTPTI